MVIDRGVGQMVDGLACPFCGLASHLQLCTVLEPAAVWVTCHNCQCSGPAVEDYESLASFPEMEKEAVERWNRRSPLAALREEIERATRLTRELDVQRGWRKL